MDIVERLVDSSAAKTHVRQAFSLYARDRLVPERNINLMPLEFRQQVCSCNVQGYITTDKYPGIINTCTNCHKPESYYLFRCVACESLFIHDFRAYFCWREPRCWDCINSDPVQCASHMYCEYYWAKELWIPPVLPKPVTFTDEELANVFDFD